MTGEAFWQIDVGGGVSSVVAGDNITVDDSDPTNPVVSSSTSAADVEAAGRWEVIVGGVPAVEVTNEAGDDWLYAWTGA